MVFISGIVNGAKSLVTPLIQPLFVPFLYWTLTSLGTILSTWTNGDRIQDENDFLNPLQSRPYDFIIVGAGSAGCLLANRLSRAYSVLLIEAGGEPNPLQFIPGFALFYPNFPEVDWQHRTVPQRFGSLMSANGESSWSTGLGLGGTGTLNYMIHLRGHRRDFDNWATVTNYPSWSWEGVLPFFRSYENYEVPGDPVNHGYNGDLRIESPGQPSTASSFVRAGGELGYPHVDLNAPFDEGFDIIRYPIRRGVRQAPYKAFLEPIRYRNSLTIMKFAQVNKILFREGNIAYGVEYDRHGRTYMAYASREVVISSGAVGSPKILMLSGIGPRAHLQDLNIPVIADLPVGENLQDHLGVYLSPFFIRPGLGYFLDRDLTIGQFIKWFTLGRGRLANSGCEASGLIASELAKSRGEGDWPDIHLITYGLTMFRSGAENVARIFNLKYDELDRYLRHSIGRDSLYVVVSGARPFARGFIRLGGSSPYDKLIIDPNYLGDPGERDLQALLDGVKRSLFLMENTTAGMEMGAQFTDQRLPGCENLEFRSDAYWICFIRRYSVTLHHPTGTAALGTVVDSELRVMGTRGLRVIDASIQPVVVTTNTQASTLMIAEKGADMILRFWRERGNIGWSGRDGGVGAFRGNGMWARADKNVMLQGGMGQAGTNGTGASNDTATNVSPDVPPAVGSLPASGQPTRYPGARPPGGKVRDDQMGNRFQQSFEELKMLSELARERYNGNFGSGTNGTVGTTSTTTTSTTSTTTRPSTTATATTTTLRPPPLSRVNLEGNVGGTWNKGLKDNNELDYYYDDEGDSEDYEDEDKIPTPPAPPSPPRGSGLPGDTIPKYSPPSPVPQTRTRVAVKSPEVAEVPRPPGPPSPPRQLNESNSSGTPAPPPPLDDDYVYPPKYYVGDQNAVNGDVGTGDKLGFEGDIGSVNSNPNSLDEVEQYFHNKYKVGFNNF